MSHYTAEEITSFQQFIDGDERGFNNIYKSRYKTVLRYARKMLQDDFEIDSIIQDAFLHAWNHRKRIKNLEHLQRFIHLCIRWRCYEYYRRKENKSEPYVLPLDPQTYVTAYELQQETEQREASLIEAEKLRLIEQAIPYLCGSRKNIIELFNRGFSHKKIAKRIGMSYQRITRELKEALEALKRITQRLKKAADTFKKRPLLLVSDFQVYLTAQQILILKLYYEERYSFTRISQELNMTQFQIAKQYLSIVKKTNGLKNRL